MGNWAAGTLNRPLSTLAAVMNRSAAPGSPEFKRFTTWDEVVPVNTVPKSNGEGEIDKVGVACVFTGSKSALTVCEPLITMLQVLVPVHAPDQPLKPDALSAVAVRVTVVSWSKFAAQFPGQLIPRGLLVTVPVPGPVRFTNRG